MPLVYEPKLQEAAQKSRTQRPNPLLELQRYGQSIWLDYMSRHLITSGEFRRLVEEDGLSGVTSNPSIFEKALTGSRDYDIFLATEAAQEQDANARYEDFAIRDIQDAADILQTVYERTQRADGYASLEVSPYLAHDTQRTVQEARRLWKRLNRENVMIKVPATPEGVPAIRQLIGEGINVNVTLLFSQERYIEVADAFIAGLEDLATHAGDVSQVASVASFFVSRIDTAVDAQIEARLKATSSPEQQARLRSLLGKVAIANSKLAYQRFKEVLKSPRWRALQARDARPQRMLWASTSTKNPRYRDVLYVEELIGAATISTLTPATMDAFRDHGQVRATLEEGVEDAQHVMDTLAEAGISIAEITDGCLNEGVQRFSDSLDQLLAAIRKKLETAAIDRGERIR